MKYKILSSIFMLLPFVSGGGLPNFMDHIEECRNTTNATQDEFFNVMRHEIPKTKAEECMIACVQKKMGFMAADNKMNLDKILAGIEHLKNFDKDRFENLKKIYEGCKASEETEKDECTAAKKFAACVYPKERELGPPRPPPGGFPGPHGPGPHGPGPRGPGPHGPPPFNKNIEECRNKTNASHFEVGNVMRHEIPKTKNEQCMLACIQKKWKFMGEDNKINMEKIEYRYRMIKERNPTMYNRTIQMYIDCKEIETNEKDECEAAKKYAECLFPKEKMNHLPPVMRRNVQECKSKTNATDAEIYTSVIAREIPKSKAESCMLACMQKKSGAMTADNTIAIDKIKNNFRNLRLYNEDLYNKSNQILEDCKAKETKESDECVAAKKFAECVIPKQMELKTFMVAPIP